MAFALPAAASAISAAKATLMTTLKSVAFNALTNLAISAALSAFQPQVGQSGRTFEFVIDPDGPIPFAAGRVGVAGSVIHRDTFGPDLMYYGIPFVLSGAGPIDGIESFKADDYQMAFDANGGATTEPYRQELFFRSVLGHQPAPVALTTPSGLKNGATLPGWTAAHKLSGKAAGLIVMAENSKGSAFPTGEIKPLITFRGLKVYDPRLDSTYPGGSGSHRLNNPATWTYSANPILWALKWALGLWEGPTGRGAPQVDYQVGGIGAKLSGIDVPAFVAAANVADANGWTVSAYPNTDDDKHQVLETFLQAGGAIYSQRAGKISCIQRAAPRTSIVTISAADTAGPLEIDTAASRINRINTLRPRFWSPAHRWQMTALDGEVTATTYREQDGAVRSRGIDYPYVSDARQAAQLAALQIAHTREGIAGVIPLKPHLQRIRPGDAFTITEPGFVLNGLKCLCLNTDYDPATGVVRVSFVSETDGKYPFALGQSPTPPTPQVLTPVDPRYVTPPLPIDWTITPRPGSGAGLPTFDLSGVVSNDTATSILVEFYEVPSGANPNDTPPVDTGWQSAGVWPPTATSIPITVQPDRYYWVGVKYIRNSNYSDRTVWGPYRAGKLLAEIDPAVVGEIVDDVLGQVEAGLDERDKSEALAEVVLETILNEQAGLEREASQRIDDLAAEALARGEAFTLAVTQSQQALDAYSASASMTFATIVGVNGGLAATLQEAKSYSDGKAQEASLIYSTKTERENGDANTLQQARSYTDDYKSEAGLTFSTKTERENGDAATVLQAKSYTDAFKSEAAQTYATQAALGSGLASTLNQAKSYSDGQLSSALNTVYTKAQTDSGLATTLQEAKSYSDGKAQEASLIYSTKTERENGDANTLQQARSYTDDYKSEAGLTFSTKTERENGDAATVLQAKSYTDAFKSEAGQLFAAQSSLFDVSATASLALTTAQNAQTKLNEARVVLLAEASGGQPAFLGLQSGTNGGQAALVAPQVILGTNAGGTIIPVIQLIDGLARVTSKLYVGMAGGGQVLIDGPAQRIDIFDPSGNLMFRAGKLT